MVTDPSVNVGAGAVRVALDVSALDAWLTGNVEGYAGPLTVEQFNGGQSNPTYRLTTPGARYVMRRKPPGLLVKGAHDVLREARVISALAATPVPVPAARLLAVLPNSALAGTAVPALVTAACAVVLSKTCLDSWPLTTGIA